MVCGSPSQDYDREYASWGQRFVHDFQERLKTDLEEVKMRKNLHKNCTLNTFDLFNYHTVDEIHEHINQVRLNLDNHFNMHTGQVFSKRFEINLQIHIRKFEEKMAGGHVP